MDQLKQLMEYTKFHIGVYTTLCTIFVSVIGLDIFKPHTASLRPYLLITLVCFVLASIFGDLVGRYLISASDACLTRTRSQSPAARPEGR